MEQRDSLGHLPALPQKFKPLARSKSDDPTFSKPDAYALVGRLAAQWPYLTAEEGREDVLAQEYLAQFDGYDPALVQDAATVAIGKATRGAPTAAEIKLELRTMLSARAPKREPFRADDDHYRPNTPAEVERRARVISEAKKRFSFGGVDKPAVAEVETPWRPLDETESENLGALMARMRGE